MKECMAQVKDAMGPDAVILHTKKYREGGFLGYGSSEVVEVTAAIEDQPENVKPPKPAKPRAVEKPAPQPRNVLNQYKTNGTPAMVQQLQQQPNAAPSIDVMAGMPQNAATMPAAPLAAPTAARTADQQKIDQLEGELAQMKAMLAQVMNKEAAAGKVTLQDVLQKQEVASPILKELAVQATAGEPLLDYQDPQAKGVLSKFLAANMHFSAGIDLQQKPRTVALIGATGVGKTTTLAKIAARFVLEQNINAAMITADTYRISAVEQLKTYADIIGVPLTIVYTPEELKVALHKYADKDLVLVDTAGRSQHNSYQMQELQDFLQAAPQLEKHLVLSATTKEQDAAQILQKFSACEPDHIIFTKTDETSSLGMILNLLYQQDLSLSFLTNGQSVPDDIVPATPDALAELLLRAQI